MRRSSEFYLSPRVVAIIAAGGLALAGCTSSETEAIEKSKPVEKSSADPALVADAQETNPDTTTESSTGSRGVNICDITTSLEGAAPVAQEGQTAKDAVLGWAPYIKEDFGIDEAVFRQAVESGQVEFHEDKSEGPVISGSEKQSQGSMVGFDLEC